MEKPRRSYPESERFYVLREGNALGPHEIEELLEGIDLGDFDYDDLCLPESGGAPEPLRDLLDWEDANLDGGDEDDDGEEDDEADGADGADGDSDAAGEMSQGGDGTRRGSQRRRFDPVLYRGHQSILTFPLATIALIGGLGGAVWAHPIDSRLSLALFAVACGALGYLALMRYLREYFVTPRRVELVSGLLARSSREVRITDIRAINVVCRGIGGWIGIGTVEFYTTGDLPEVEFRHAWAAARIKRLVRDLQDEVAS